MTATHTLGGHRPAGTDRSLRVPITACRFYGHVNAVLPLARAAQRAGHEVVAATGADMAEEVSARGLRAWAVGPTRVESGMPASPAEFWDAAGRRAADLLPLAAAWRPDLVVSEEMELAGAIVAARHDARFVVHGLGIEAAGDRRGFSAEIDALGRRWAVTDLARSWLGAPYVSICPPALQPAIEDAGPVRRLRPGMGEPTPGQRLRDALDALPYAHTVHLTLGTVFHRRRPDAMATAIAGLRELAVNRVVTVGPELPLERFGPQPSHVVLAPYLPHSLLLPRPGRPLIDPPSLHERNNPMSIPPPGMNRRADGARRCDARPQAPFRDVQRHRGQTGGRGPRRLDRQLADPGVDPVPDLALIHPHRYEGAVMFTTQRPAPTGEKGRHGPDPGVVAGVAGIASFLLLSGAQALQQVGGTEPAFDAPLEDVAAFVESRDPVLFGIGTFLALLGLASLLAFVGALGARVRRLEGETPWRSAVALVAAGVFAAGVLSGGWEYAVFRVADGIDPQLSRFAFDLGNLSFASSWVMLGLALAVFGWLLLAPDDPSGLRVSTALRRVLGVWALVAGLGMMAARGAWTSPLWLLPYALVWLWVLVVAVVSLTGRLGGSARQGSSGSPAAAATSA